MNFLPTEHSRLYESNMDVKFSQLDKIQMRFNDIDLLGHVNNATIGEYFDLGRMNYLHRIFGGSVRIEHESFVIASTTSNFFVPILIHYKIEVCTKITKIGNKSLNMYQVVYDENGRKLVECISVMVAFSSVSQQTIVIPMIWRDWIKSIDEDCIDRV